MSVEILKKMPSYIRLMRLDKQAGFLLLLYPTLCALWLANKGMPSGRIIFLFTLGVFITRSLGCVIDDFFDKDLDVKVLRTRNRPLACKEVSPKEALVIITFLSFLALLVVINLGTLSVCWSVIATILMVIYPLMKRVTYLPQAILGITFSFGIVLAFVALEGKWFWEGQLLFISNFFWIMAYDTQYAMADRKDDEVAGIKSTAVLFKEKSNIFVVISQVAMLLSLLWLGIYAGLKREFYYSLFLILMLFVYQYILISRCAYMRAFKNNKYVGLCLFLGVVFSLPL